MANKNNVRLQFLPRNLDKNFRLDYQPLFGKMSPHSSSGSIKDRTRETAEMEPKSEFAVFKSR